MKFKVDIKSDRKTITSKNLPQSFPGPRLAGSEVEIVSGDFGDLYLQEFDGGNFIIRYSVLNTQEDVEVSSECDYPGVYLLLMLKNRISLNLNGTEDVRIREGYFTFINGEHRKTRVEFPKQQQFISLEAILAPELFQSVLKEFPELFNLFQGAVARPPNVVLKPARRTHEEVYDHLHYLFTYSDHANWRRSYYEYRVRDLTWKSLATAAKTLSDSEDVTDDEEDKARRVSNLILERLDEHVVIKDLGKAVASSATQLKKLFQKVFGMGIHEYRKEQRLKKAVTLIRSGMMVKDAAAEVGLSSSKLIRAYYKQYGTTPGTIRKKDKN